jgi:drug/metabolite transporter (DMT)-like permease
MSAPPRRLIDAAVFAAPGVFVLLWASGFIGAKFGLPYAEPMTFLAVRMGAVVALFVAIVLVTRPPWPSPAGLLHSAVTGLLVHGAYLGGVFEAIQHRLPAGYTALVVSLQPVLTSTLANRLLGERVTPRQWAGLALGLAGVYLVVHGHTGGGAPPAAWAAATVGLVGITIGTLYQKRFGGGIDWRTGMLIQYVAAGTLFAGLALAFETMRVQWSGEFLFAVAWLVVVLSFGAIWLLYFMIRHKAATRVVSLF